MKSIANHRHEKQMLKSCIHGKEILFALLFLYQLVPFTLLIPLHACIEQYVQTI